jgi:hypothetical protein
MLRNRNVFFWDIFNPLFTLEGSGRKNRPLNTDEG